MASMLKHKPPSKAQAMAIARIWSAVGCAFIGQDRVDPTWAICIRNGWFVPNGKTGTFPNGSIYNEHVVSDDGLHALERFLFDARCKRRQSPSPKREIE